MKAAERSKLGITRTGQTEKIKSLRTRLALTTALATVAFSYVGRAAYAGVCTGGAGTYTCSGAANPGTDSLQGLGGGGPLSVTTTAGFGLSVATPYAINMFGYGGSTFTDNFNSSITGQFNTVNVYNYTSGDLSITSTDTVTATSANRSAIYGVNYDNTTANLTINAATVVSSGEGVTAINRGTGTTNISVSGPVTAGGAYSGIQATTYGTGQLSISAASVTAGVEGVYANNTGTGGTDVTISGTVTGGSGASIRAGNNGAGNTVITLNAGANVGAGASGTAILNGLSTGAALVDDSTVTVNAGAAVNGSISLGEGSDNLIFDGGDFNGVTQFDGGGGVGDTLSFQNVDGGIDGTIVNNFENVVIDSGADISFSNTLTAGTVTVSNGGLLTGNLTLNGNLIVDTGLLAFTNGDTTNVSGLLQIGAGGTIGLLFDSFGPGIIDIDALFTGTAPNFAAGFLNSQFFLGTNNAANVGQQRTVEFGGDTLVLTAQLIGGGGETVVLSTPSGGLLFTAGLLGMAGLRRRRKKTI